MPRMLAPRRESMRRSGASLCNSRSSLPSYSLANPNRRSPLNNGYNGSQFSLRRSSINNESPQSSSHSLRQQSLYKHQAAQQTSNQNAMWNIGGQGSVSQPPSLASSETSEKTESSLSRSSTQSSLHPPCLPMPPTSRARYEAMHRYYALRRALLQHQAGNPESHRHNAFRSSPLQDQRNRSLPGTPGNSFLPQTQTKEEDTLWGQFVDVAVVEEDSVRRKNLLSRTRMHPATLSRLSLAQRM